VEAAARVPCLRANSVRFVGLHTLRGCVPVRAWDVVGGVMLAPGAPRRAGGGHVPADK
jgi:hypothetical protein